MPPVDIVKSIQRINQFELIRQDMILGELFPQLKNYSKTDMIPKWQNHNSPWSILDNSKDNNLQQQIKKFCKSIDFETPSNSRIDIDLTNGPIFIDKSAVIHDYVRIEGPCFIGPESEIRHSAYLRKGSWISEGVVVGHSSEIKNSILLPGSKAPHFNYIGDSILGFETNLGAGTKLSNVRNDKREIRLAYKNKEYIDTGMNKLGALIGDFSKLGCNVVTNPGAIIPSQSMIPPNCTITNYYL